MTGKKGEEDKYEKRLTALEDSYKKLEDSNLQILTKINELTLGFCGSEKIGVEGVIGVVKRHDEYIETDKKQKYKFAGVIAAITFLIAYGSNIFQFIFKKG